MGERRLALKDAAAQCAQTFVVHYQGANGIETEKIWIRTLTQTEVDQIDQINAEKMVEARKKFAPGTAMYQALLGQVEDMTLSELVGNVLITESQDLATKARRKMPNLLPVDESAFALRSASELAKAQEEYEARKKAWEEKFNALVDEMVEKRELELKARPRAELVETAMRQLVRIAVQQSTNNIAEDGRILFSVYLDEDRNQRYFESIDDIPQAGSVRDYLLAAIDEVDWVRPVDIKNSQGRSVLLIGPAENILEPTEESSTQTSQESSSPKRRSRGGRKP